MVAKLTINILPRRAIRARCQCRQFFLSFATRGISRLGMMLDNNKMLLLLNFNVSNYIICIIHLIP